MTHHLSCKPSDKSLVWHCNQCGENESAEAILDKALQTRWTSASVDRSEKKNP